MKGVMYEARKSIIIPNRKNEVIFKVFHYLASLVVKKFLAKVLIFLSSDKVLGVDLFKKILEIIKNNL